MDLYRIESSVGSADPNYDGFDLSRVTSTSTWNED